VIVDGGAGWCHWCREMDATSYRDPEVLRLIKDKYVTVKVDVDDEPAFERRYRDWGWPATVIMSADAEEIAKYRGFMPAQRLAEVLRDNSDP